MNETQLKIEALRGKFAPGFASYIEIDEGWYQIVIDCDKELTELDPSYRIVQIKEKFGGLRYYFNPSEGCDKPTFWKMKEVVYKYEGLAWQTCEATGKPGILMKSIGGWYKTLNPEYAAETLHYAKYRPSPGIKQEVLGDHQSRDQ